MPPTTFGTLCVWNVALPGIDALGREREEEVLAGLQAGRLEQRLHDFFGRARVGRRLEADQHARMQVLGDRLDRRDDVGHVGVLRLAQRRRHADVDRVELADDRRSRSSHRACRRRCSALTSASRRRECRSARVDRLRPSARRGRCRSPGIRPSAELDRERQSDVSQPDDARSGAAVLDFFEQRSGEC